MLEHHAYFVEGPTSLLPELERKAREQAGFPDADDPDVYVRSYEKFGIDESRDLRERASMKSVSGCGLFVLATPSMTTEAQQALLKLFEEPQRGLTFILLVPHGTLIMTLRSRCLPLPFSEAAGGTKEADAFLKAGYKERTEQITKMLKDDEGVRERVREFLNALERTLYARMKKAAGKQKEETVIGLEDIAKLRSYLSDRSPSLKMILEHLAAALLRLS